MTAQRIVEELNLQEIERRRFLERAIKVAWITPLVWSLGSGVASAQTACGCVGSTCTSSNNSGSNGCCRYNGTGGANGSADANCICCCPSATLCSCSGGTSKCATPVTVSAVRVCPTARAACT